MFSVEDKLGLLQEETLAVFYIRMLRETVRQRGKKMEDARKSRLEQASSSVPKVKKQTDVKGLYSLKASPATKAENSLSVAGKMKNVVVRLSTSSRVSWWQVWKQMHSWLFRHADGERKPSARSIRRYSRKSCYYQKKKRSKVVYLKIQIQWILSCGKLENWDWTLRRDTTENFQDASGAKLNSGKKRQSGGIIQKGEPHERNPCAPDFQEQAPEETSRQAGCTSKVAWNLARKYASSSRRQLRFILLWRRQRHISVYVCCGFGSFNAQCWARRIELRYNGYFDKVQNHISDLPRSGAVQLNE